MCRFFCAVVAACFRAALLLPCIVQGAMSSYPISITHERQGDAYAIVARNSGPAPISIRLTLPVTENVAADRPYPLVGVVAPYSVQTLLRVAPAKPDLRYRFTTRSEQSFGDPAAIHDADALYRLPFSDGSRVQISQAFGGSLSTHKGAENLHAVDFPVGEATPVVAARSGVVVDVDADYIDGGPHESLKSKANQVTVLHSDGTLGHYAHLAPGHYVHLGQHVQAGTFLGLAGNTGFSYGPHLHFVVVRAIVEATGRVRHASVPIEFYNHNPPLAFSPQQGLEITADYSNSPPDLASSGIAQLPLGHPMAKPVNPSSPVARGSGASELTTDPRPSRNPNALPPSPER